MKNRQLIGVVAAALVFSAVAANAQSILTFAGGGSDDGRLATEVRVYNARSIAFDRFGNLHYAEAGSGRVRRIDAGTSIVTTVAGNGASGLSGDNGPAIAATLNEPQGLAFDSAGNLYIADSKNDRVRRVDATGTITTFVEGLKSPVGLAIRDGHLFVTEAAFDGNRVRRINLATKVVETIAGAADGSFGFSGDGGAATSAKLQGPRGLAFDAAGNLYIADTGNDRVRKIDASGTITTVAGGGKPADEVGDGPVATDATFGGPFAVAFDSKGNLYVSGGNGGIRRIDATSKAISTVARAVYLPLSLAVDSRDLVLYSDDDVGYIRRIESSGETTVLAGGGTFLGDGRVATAAILQNPLGLALDARGDLLIADSANNSLRRVSAADGRISTVAGRPGAFYIDSQEGIDAKDAVIGAVPDVAVDSAGNIYTADGHNGRIWRIDAAGKIFSFAGGPTEFLQPLALAVDSENNVYFAEKEANRVRRVDAQTRTITTVAGTGTAGYSGDGAAATNATLNAPVGVAVDGAKNVYIADAGNFVVRRVDAAGIITTYAGGGTPESGIGDGGPATGARLEAQHIAVRRSTGDLYVADNGTHRIRKIEAAGTHIITTVAGSATSYLDPGFAGDDGPAIDAKLNIQYALSGVTVSASGDVYLSDTINNRVRTVQACRAVQAPQLTSPANGATGATTSPRLTWSGVSGAFRYDVLLDTVSPPRRVVATDVSETAFTPANLAPSTKYFWSVVAKGDPFCTPRATAQSTVASFTTSEGCDVGAFSAIAPADGASNISIPVTFSWQAAPGAGTYDLYLGGVNPPAFFQSGITGTSLVTSLVGVGTQYWFVVAHAACDSTKTSSTAIRSFTTNQSPGCTPPLNAVNLLSPPSGSSNLAPTVTLAWQTAGCATSPFDIYLGESTSPPLLATGVTASTLQVPLSAGTTYYWRVVAQNVAGATSISSAVASFTTRSCTTPGATSILFAPPTVAAGATYTIVWSAAADLDPDGGYLVERSTSADFASNLGTQVTSSTAASFIAESVGTYYHRVRAIPGCDPSRSGPPSTVSSVTVSPARPSVVFSLPPSSVVSSLNESLEDKRSVFALENLGTAPVQVIVGRGELAGSRPFFSVADTRGGGAFVTLEPRTPRLFEVRYSGPRIDTPGSYQGIIAVAATGEGLAVTPYAFVNLKIGGSPAPKPEFLVNGRPATFAMFPGARDETTRPPLVVTVRNPGSEPMELAEEIGPEVWLVPDATWNATSIAPGASRPINFTTRRADAPNDSSLPRFTYFTVRTKDGATARLLVQDNDAIDVTAGRNARLALDVRSFVIPDVFSRVSGRGTPLVTRIRLSNVGGASVQSELIFTPSGKDGFDATAVKRAVVVVPKNDVLVITDPLAQIFGATGPAKGQIEVRLPRERLGLVGISADVISLDSAGAGFALPVLNRGEGARDGVPHVLLGITANASVITAMTLAETTGVGSTRVRAVLFDGSGARKGDATYTLPAYGHERVDNVVPALGGSSVAGGRIEITVESGGGAVAGVATVTDLAGERGATTISRAIDESPGGATLAKAFLRDAAATVSVTTVVPVLPPSTSAVVSQTALSFVAPPGPAANFIATFRNAGGTGDITKTIPVDGGATKSWPDVLRELFELPASIGGSIFVEAPEGGKVYAVLQPTPAAGSAPGTFVPLPTNLAEALTSAASAAQRPLFLDGLEQSTDPTRGSRWVLVLNEVGGVTGFINVRLYESGNRSRTIGERAVFVGKYQQVALDSVFAALGLDTPERRKDRTNVQVVVTAISGGARVAATAMAIDNASGDSKLYALQPSVGSATPSVDLVVPVVEQTPVKRRGTRH